MTATPDPLATLQPDPQDHSPRYVRVAQRIRDAIGEGLWRAGEALPPERQMCERLGVSRVTLRKALDSLGKEGLVEPRHGSGTYVADRIRQPMSMLTSFSDDMRARGRVPGSRWIDHGHRPATPEEALSLGLPPTASVFRLRRLRLADGEPMAVETTAGPGTEVPDPDAIGDSLYGYLEAKDRAPARALEYLRAANLEAADAALLGQAAGDAALHIVRLAYLEDGSPIEYTRSLYRGDRYDFIAELTRPPGPKGGR